MPKLENRRFRFLGIDFRCLLNSVSLSWKVISGADFCQPLWQNTVIFSLGTNMKNYTARERWVEHSRHPTLDEYVFEKENSPLTS